ncbi:putative carboxylesterase 8 [Iris pallida]|uniref:Carboxylesterase 8 n=1 Tax=Iris pallida TaxID=29817 RepID=A0AAX6GRQ3_IRIPA|nr:putative carboxylesterase 8 [Iris pallida]
MEKSATTAATRSDAPKSESIFLRIVEHPDGSVTRPVVPLVPPDAGGSEAAAIISKDVLLDEAKGTWLRLYLPSRPPPEAKLPVLLYLHGGGFVLFSPDFLLYNAFCERAAAALPALVVSLHYRLSPEHRLPLAYDDAADALRWLLLAAGPSGAADPWVASHGDLSRCFLAGSSSGGNIAYHAGLRMRAAGQQLKVAGLVMIQPYFGGEERTGSEARSGEDPVLPLRASDMMWRMALPAGATRDHEYCNPTAAKAVGGGAAPALPRCLVTGCKGDPLFDRQEAFAEMLEKAGAAEELVVRFDHEGYHAIELFEPASADKLLAEVREFVYGSASK